MKVLLTGDLHIGRASSSVPAERVEPYLAASAWERIVDLAIEGGVAAILVSGDLIEASNRYFEARGPLEAGLRRLTDVGIRTIAVSGNHDFDILPRLADKFVEKNLAFELLGRDGVWTETRIEAAGEALTVVGWSFPKGEVRDDPVATFPWQGRRTEVTIGLVHGDLGAATSKYAPLSERTLTGVPLQGWLLGHIHAPMLRTPEGAPWILYPGSPQALDPGEAGVHGVWMVEVAGSSVSAPWQVSLSTVRYEQHGVDVSGIADEAALQARLDMSLQEVADRAGNEGGRFLTDLVVDLHVRGDTPAAHAVPTLLQDLKQQYSATGSVMLHIRSSADSTALPLDLHALAEGAGLTRLLARAIIDLEHGLSVGPEAQSLLRRVLPLTQSISLRASRSDGDDVERPAKLEESFYRAEALKAARTLLAAIAGAPEKRGTA